MLSEPIKLGEKSFVMSGPADFAVIDAAMIWQFLRENLEPHGDYFERSALCALIFITLVSELQEWI
jgi:hypothetical protein